MAGRPGISLRLRLTLLYGGLLAVVAATLLGVAVVVLDRNGMIDVWNAHAEELWGLRQEEALGQHFLALDIGLPVERLKQSIKQALEDASFRGRTTLAATTRRGTPIECEITCLPLALHDNEIAGAILLIERSDGKTVAEGEDA